MSHKLLLEASSTLVGFTIGAGILGLPYVVAHAGFLTGLLNLVVIGCAVLMMNLMLGEAVLRTKEHHQLTGYANLYLGKIGKYLMMICMILGMYGPLIAYILKEGEFFSALLSPIFGGTPFIYSLLFAVFGTVMIFLGLQIIEKSEVIMVLLIIAVLVVITVFTIPHIRLENLTGFNLKNIFLPYGVVLFACIGMSAMPEMKEELRNHKHLMKKAIILGTLVPLIIYIIFCLVVVGVTGVENVTDGAILGLGVVLGGTIMKIGLVFGIFTMTISFLSVGLALKDMFYFDFKIKRVQAAILVCLIPIASYIIIYSMKIHNIFYRMLDITGAVLFSLLGIIVIIMSLKATQYGDRKPEYVIQGKTILGVVIIGMFIMGFINEFINLL